MFEPFVGIVLAAAGFYLALGVVVAVVLHAGGLRRLDPGVERAGIFFRMLVTPGLVALWPWMLRRWRLAMAGRPRLGEVERPVTERGLRRIHRLLVQGLIVVVPVVAAVAVIARPAVPRMEGSAKDVLPPEPEPLANVVQSWDAPFGDLPVRARLRGDGDADGRGGALQVELEVARDLEIPSLVLFWSGGDATPSSGVFLGAVWGPGVRRYALPAGARRGGSLVLHSIAHGERIGVLFLESGDPSRE